MADRITCQHDPLRRDHSMVVESNWSDADRHQHKIDVEERAVLMEQVRCFLADYSAATKGEGQA